VKTVPDPELILQRLQERGISVYSVAVQLGMNPGHLRRVLRGERLANAALLRAAAELAETVEQADAPRGPEDVERLIGAAVHVFLLKRGKFESAICGNLGQQWPWEQE